MWTPVTSKGLRKYDDLDPIDAVLVAWTNPGAVPRWHQLAQREVYSAMPLLARALDRLAREKEN